MYNYDYSEITNLDVNNDHGDAIGEVEQQLGRVPVDVRGQTGRLVAIAIQSRAHTAHSAKEKCQGNQSSHCRPEAEKRTNI